jgi:hypothetical protein
MRPGAPAASATSHTAGDAVLEVVQMLLASQLDGRDETWLARAFDTLPSAVVAAARFEIGSDRLQ